jgi:hypothetical protein
LPDVPEEPEFPEEPEDPEVPFTPDVPLTPEVPFTPEDPDEPFTPEVPDEPLTPEVPEVPEPAVIVTLATEPTAETETDPPIKLIPVAAATTSTPSSKIEIGALTPVTVPVKLTPLVDISIGKVVPKPSVKGCKEPVAPEGPMLITPP